MAAMHRRHVQRKGNGRPSGGAAIPESGGAPLNGEVRSRMEGQLGADLSGVKIHTGGDSARAATDLGARAFTVDNDVHFNHGEFAPGSREGDQLLAHELTHVVQGQRSGVQRKSDSDTDGGAQDDLEVSQPADPAEQEADQVAEQAAGNLHHAGGGEGGGKAAMIGAGGSKLARKIYRDPAPGAAEPAHAPGGGGAGGPPGATPGAEQKSQEEQDCEKTIDEEKVIIDTARAPSNVGLAETILANETRAGQWQSQFPNNEKVRDFIQTLRTKQLEVYQTCNTDMQQMSQQVEGVDPTKPETTAQLEQIKGSTLLQQWRENPLVGVGKKYENSRIKDVEEKIQQKDQAIASEQEKKQQAQAAQQQHGQGGANGGGPPGPPGGGGAEGPAAPTATTAPPPPPQPAAPPTATPAPAPAPDPGPPASTTTAPEGNGQPANGPANAQQPAQPNAQQPAQANAQQPAQNNAQQGQQQQQQPGQNPPNPGPGNQLTPQEREEKQRELAEIQLERAMQQALKPFIMVDKLVGGCASAVACAGVLTGNPVVAAVGGITALAIGAVTSGATFYREYQMTLANAQLAALTPEKIQELIDKWNVDPAPDFADKLASVQAAYDQIKGQLAADKKKAAEPGFLRRIGLTLKSIFKSKGGDQADVASTGLEGASQIAEHAVHVAEPLEKVVEGFGHVVPFISLATHIGTGIAELLAFKHAREKEEKLRAELGMPPAGAAAAQQPAQAQQPAPP
jgi:hypothetical protein